MLAKNPGPIRYIPVTDIFDPLQCYNSNVIPYEGIVHSIPCFLHYVSKGTVYNAIAFGATGLSGSTCTSIYRYRDTFVNKYIHLLFRVLLDIVFP